VAYHLGRKCNAGADSDKPGNPQQAIVAFETIFANDRLLFMGVNNFHEATKCPEFSL
jgi:hypothetical protein